jgi:serine/threonine-protein kinase
MDSSRPRALPDWSAVPADSDDDRRLLNRRLAYFGAVAALIAGSFFVVVLAVQMALGVSLEAFARQPANEFHFVATVLFAVEWLLCRGGHRSSRQLNVIDVGTTFGGLAVFGASLVFGPRRGFESALILTLITVSGVLTRAIVVPGTARRTFWVSSACGLPALVAGYWIARTTPMTAAGNAWPPIAATVYVGAWMAATVALATLASRIIYGLSQRVRAATELGQYTLEEKIGEGGMGMVYRARHALLRRPTAIKLLPAELAGERSVQRFEREVQLTSALTHPNTIAIYDYGRSPDGVFYYAMEYLDGITLDDLIVHDGPQPAARVVYLLKQICGALAEAHGVGLIHRDVKPANVMLCVRGGLADYVKVLDFGVVKEVAQTSPKVSSAQAIVGTPAYLAPEALTTPDEIDARVDVYAVGAVAYELLTGKPVFDGASLIEVCAKILHEAPPPVSARRGSPIPAQLEALVHACLSKDRDARPQSVVDISRALDSSGDGWTAGDALRWWEQRAPAIRAAMSGAGPRSTVTDRRTIGVDLLGRRADGVASLEISRSGDRARGA